MVKLFSGKLDFRDALAVLASANCPSVEGAVDTAPDEIAPSEVLASLAHLWSRVFAFGAKRYRCTRESPSPWASADGRFGPDFSKAARSLLAERDSALRRIHASSAYRCSPFERLVQAFDVEAGACVEILVSREMGQIPTGGFDLFGLAWTIHPLDPFWVLPRLADQVLALSNAGVVRLPGTDFGIGFGEPMWLTCEFKAELGDWIREHQPVDAAHLDLVGERLA